MKYFSVSTTTKLYLLTLLVLSGILFLNHSAFAQEKEQKVSVSHERLKLLEKYKSWTDQNVYGEFKKELGVKTLNEFKSFLSRVTVEDQACLAETDPEKLSKCREKIKFDFKLAKKYNRVLKYLQIEEGKPNVCVKADLGVNVSLKARSINAAPEAEPSNVYLCTDNKGVKILRVPDGKGGLLELSAEDEKRPELQIANLPPKGALDILIKKFGLTRPSGTISANPNPCTIAEGAQTCGEVEVEWDVSDDTSDPVEVKTKSGKFIEKSRNGSADILDIGPDGETFILYSLGRKINEVTVKAIQK